MDKSFVLIFPSITYSRESRPILSTGPAPLNTVFSLLASHILTLLPQHGSVEDGRSHKLR